MCKLRKVLIWQLLDIININRAISTTKKSVHVWQNSSYVSLDDTASPFAFDPYVDKYPYSNWI